MGGMSLGVWLTLALAAPPLPAAPRGEKPDPALTQDAQLFATWLVDLANRVAADYPRDVKPADLLAAGLTELYESLGEKLRPQIAADLATATHVERARLVAEARRALGSRPGLTAIRAFVVATNGFTRVTDPYCGLMWQPGRLLASSDAEFGLGFELEGATGSRWIAYQLENFVPAGEWNGPGRTVRSPTGVPWIVRRVLPGSPAGKAGLRPGDAITHLAGSEITPETNGELFLTLAASSSPYVRGPEGGAGGLKPISLRVRRKGHPEPLQLTLSRTGYEPESVFGVMRREDGSWDYRLDRQRGIGYIRVGAIEESAAAAFEQAVAGLIREGATGLILDLRWCPGGYVVPTARIAGVFLPAGKVIASIRSRRPTPGRPEIYTAQGPPGGEAWLKLPLAVLVNGETTGGGEMIAAALQDHGRAVIIGQRTFGKANIMNLVETPFPGVGFRVSTGYSLRPNGKSRHRFPDSLLTEEWGVRPDRGFEVPLTPDLSARLQAGAELQAIRPFGSGDAVPFDDPLADPQKMVALRLLAERIRPGKPSK